MKKLITVIAVFFLMISGTVYAAQWCEKDVSDQPVLNSCVTATILPSGTEVIVTRAGARIAGDDSNKNDAGHYKMITGSNPPLQEFQIYSGYLYEFAANVFTKTRIVIMNYDNLTLNEYKWQTYWACYNEYVLPARTADCVYSGQVIPQEARNLMVAASAAGKTMTYEVYSEATGNPAYYTGSAVQVQGILDSCLDPINTVNSTMATRADSIMACADGDCVNLLICD